MIQQDTTVGGIIVVGSHTKKTTAQLEALKQLKQVVFIEFDSDLVLDESRFLEEIDRVLQEEESYLRQGRTVVVYTKRQLLLLQKEVSLLVM